jgi:hypothetical protein
MSGNKLIDQGRHYALVALAMDMYADWLRTGGAAVVKVFRGADFEACVSTMAALFREVHVRKPSASRGRSDEVFLVGLGYALPNELRPASSSRAAASGKTQGAGAVREVKKKDRALIDDMYDDDDGPAYAW